MELGQKWSSWTWVSALIGCKHYTWHFWPSMPHCQPRNFFSATYFSLLTKILQHNFWNTRDIGKTERSSIQGSSAKTQNRKFNPDIPSICKGTKCSGHCFLLIRVCNIRELNQNQCSQDWNKATQCGMLASIAVSSDLTVVSNIYFQNKVLNKTYCTFKLKYSCLDTCHMTRL